MLRKTSALLLALLLMPTIASANSDLQASLSGVPETAPLGATIHWTATFTNAGPDARPDVYMNARLGNDRCVDLRIPLQAGETRTFPCTTKLDETGPPYGLYASASITAFDQLEADPANNNVSQFLRLESASDLRIFFSYPYPAYPGLPFPIDVTYVNVAYALAQDVVITFDVPDALAVRTVSPRCVAEGTRVTCYRGDVPGTDDSNARGTFRVEVVAPDASARQFQARAEITTTSGEQTPADNLYTSALHTYTTMFVTNTNDSGDGSLRQALQTANGSCPNECLVAFRIPGLTGVATIRPRTALPAITAEDILIDGLTQARYFTDSNPAGPEIELRGSDLTEGDGLVLAVPCGAAVQGLAINGFPRYGVYHTTAGRACGPGGSWFGGHAVRENYIGLDATGTTAVPNLRGIYTDGMPMTIAGNVISANTRAGVFVVRGSVFVAENIIGLDPTRTKAMGNGASGIYFGPDADGSDAMRNHIAFNTDAGVSIDTGAADVNVYQNSIHANHSIAVDFGLDGPTPNAPIEAPEIASAVYDPVANTTTIVVRPPQHGPVTWIELYANDAPDPGGYGEGQIYLGMTTSSAGGFRLVYPGDLRGKWIAGQSIYQLITTFSHEPPVRSEAHGPFANTTSSEFGHAFEVNR
jgi:hypothetical protein